MKFTSLILSLLLVVSALFAFTSADPVADPEPFKKLKKLFKLFKKGGGGGYRPVQYRPVYGGGYGGFYGGGFGGGYGGRYGGRYGLLG